MRSRLAPALVAAALLAGAALPAAAAGPPPAAARTTPPASVAASARPSAQDIVDSLPRTVYAGALIRRDGVGAAMGPVVPDAHFRIGSTTKIFTQTVVLQLVAERRIGLDAPVRAYLPTLVPAAYERVTVRHLLDHTSGFPRPARTPGPDDGAGWWLRSVTPAGLLSASFAATDPLRTPPEPGSVQQYNGLNAFALGLIVEKATGHSFAHELRQRVILPLGLRHTSLPAADDPAIPSPHARVYVGGDDVTEQSPYPWAEGGMISTAADLDRFLTALFRGRLLPPAQQKLVFAVPHDASSAPTNTSCPGGEPCFSVGGLMRYELPDGRTAWGKTGSRPGWDNGFFATEDLEHRVVYSLNPTGADSGITHIRRIVVDSLTD
ncbi:serine hydrolase domain-containing protein [Streptomyces sp. NPDC014734]|uniref:serine hydrolase domain-containing protein n=1 Tax=Streptomyces sp. NPDC014734 TaxID=3364886 RepID=UPI0036F8F54D